MGQSTKDLVNLELFVKGMQRFVWEIMKKSRVWNDFLKNMCSKDITLVIIQILVQETITKLYTKFRFIW